MTTEMIIEERLDLVGQVRKVITAVQSTEIYARGRDVDTKFQGGSEEPKVIGYLRSNEKMILTGLVIDFAGGTGVQICGPLSGWVDAKKITDQLT